MMLNFLDREELDELRTTERMRIWDTIRAIEWIRIGEPIDVDIVENGETKRVTYTAKPDKHFHKTLNAIEGLLRKYDDMKLKGAENIPWKGVGNIPCTNLIVDAMAISVCYKPMTSDKCEREKQTNIFNVIHKNLQETVQWSYKTGKAYDDFDKYCI